MFAFSRTPYFHANSNAYFVEEVVKIVKHLEMASAERFPLSVGMKVVLLEVVKPAEEIVEIESAETERLSRLESFERTLLIVLSPFSLIRKYLVCWNESQRLFAVP